MDCSVCGMPGAFVSTTVDEVGNPSGEFVHLHCYPKYGDSFIECNRLGSSQYHSFSRAKRIVVRNMRKGSGLVFRLASTKELLRRTPTRSRWNLS